ncbi:hypothetical protein V1264_024442 [Littorina saxatilis]|uniref:non-specific serine/threonine protein kinase n=1 Tax=Littorina saxatilis TaxID=31220 RepID=A0AAN9G0H7_9CAEN
MHYKIFLILPRILEDHEAMADTFCGTPATMSPEVLRKLPYNSKADIWSLGCLVGEMATRTEGYNPASKDLLENVTVRTRERLPEEYS